MVDIAQGPPSFSPRLPTPPKENNDRSSKLGDGHYFGTLGQSVLLDTPDDSPSSSAETSRSSGDRHPKRVIFSPWTKTHDPPNLSAPTALTEAVIKRLPPSRECIAQNKSILKASATVGLAPGRPLSLSLNPGDSMITMLQSIMQQLKSSSRDSRFDSYMTLLGCLNAYEEVPDTKTLVESMTGLTEFIRRDVSATLPETGVLDSQLATQALKVLTVVLQSNDLSEAVPDGFRHFIADRAVSSVENQGTPRTMVDHYMHLIARQKFSTKIMNADRINRTLTAVRGMESRIKGNRVIGLKLGIYQRFLTQARNAMMSRAEEWLECLVASLLSPAKEIRARAIAFGTEAGLFLGTVGVVSQACVELLNRVTSTGNKCVHVLGNRLIDLLAKRDEAVDAPQIWAVPILFLRAKPRQLERWEHLKRWIVIMQRCLNSSDEKTRQQANVSWNRLIFVTSPDLSTDIIMTRMLRQPILAQLNRKSNDKASKHLKQVARSTYCNLLYYAFRPGSPHTQLDLFWEEYIMGVIGSQSSTSKSDLHFASETVAALLSSSQPRVWDQDRANQPNAMRPEELPCLDSKWVRSKAKRVLAFFSYLLERSGWQLDQDSSSNVLLVWQSFAKALGEAASKEVKVSAETMNAVAQIVSTLKRFVQHSRKSNRGDAEPAQAVVTLVQETIAKIGALPFMEKRLTQNSSEGLFEVAETPSKRHSCKLETVNSPIAHILGLLVHNVQDDQVKENYRLAIGELIEIALRGSTSRRTQLSVLRELSKLQVPADAARQRSRILLWQQIAQYAEKALANPNPRESQGNSPQFLNHDYAEVISILDVGLRQTSDEVFESWKRLTTVATQELRNGCGDKEVWQTVTEPLSTAIHEEASRSCNGLLIQCGTLMLETFQWPGSCQTLEQARELLWGPDLLRNKACTAEPLGSFYAMIGDLLEFNYSHLQSMPPNISVNLIRAISRFISSCPLSLKAVVLQRVQNRLAVWVEDSRELLMTPTASSWTKELPNAVEALWVNVISAMQSFPKMDSSTLAGIETLIAAGLNSKNQIIVSDTLNMWKETFEFEASLVHPPVIRLALMRLRPITDMKLSDSPDGDVNEVMSSPIPFAESQDEGPAQHTLSLPIQPMKVVSGEQVISHSPQRLFSPNFRSKFTLPPFDPHVSPQAPKTVARALLRSKDSNSRCAITDSIEHQPKTEENQQRDTTIMIPGTGTLPARAYGNRSWEPLLVGKPSLAVSLLEDAGNSPDFPPDNVITDELLEDSPTPRVGRREPTEPNLRRSSATLSFQSLLPSSRIDRYQDLPESEQTHGRTANVSGLRDDTDEFGSEAQLESQLANRAELPVAPGDTNNPDVDLEDPSHMTIAHNKHQANVISRRLLCKPDLFFDAPSNPLQGLGETNRQDRTEIQGTGQPETESCKANQSTDVIAMVEESIVRHDREDSGPQLDQDTRNGKSENLKLADRLFGGGEPHTGADEEQVQAQLLRDLEQASSQGDAEAHKKHPNQELANKRTRKRKGSFASKDRPNKLLKASTSQTFEVVVEPRKMDEVGNTCILIDTRPATSDRHSASPVTGHHTRSMSTRQNLDIQYDSSPSRRGVPSSHRNGPIMSNRIDRIPHINWQRKRRYEMEEFKNGERVVTPLITTRQHIDKQSKCHSMTRRADNGISTFQPQDQSISMPWQRDKARALALKVDTDQPAKQHAYGDHDAGASFVSEGDTIPDTPMEEDCTAAAAVAPGEVPLSPDVLRGKGPASTLLGQWPSMGSILGGFRSLVDQVKRIRLQPAEQREMTEMAFEMIREAQEAGRRTSGV